MTQERLQQILRELFGEAAGAVEVVAQTDRGAVWAFALSDDYENVLSHWKRLRGALSEYGLWPLLVGSEEKLRQLAGAYTENTDHASHSSGAVMAKGLSLDIDAWLRSHEERESQRQVRQASPECQATLQAARDVDDDFDDFADEDPFADDSQDEWSDAEEPQVLDRSLPEPEAVWLMLVSARHGWEVPAVLYFGGWDVCPAPCVHVALIHHWHQHYGAQLIGLTFNTMSFQVARPPRSREESLPLARQKWHFCWKWIYEGFEDETPSPEQQADELTNRARWSFGW